MICFCSCTSSNRFESTVLDLLDKTIENGEVFVNEKSYRINRLRQRLVENSYTDDLELKYDLNHALYEEYQSFKYDSAYFYAKNSSYIAHRLSDTAKTVEITYPSESPALTQGLIGISRRMARSIEALKFRTGADPIDDLAMMGTVNEAILYAPEKAKELSDKFFKNYSNLPEILQRQPDIEEADIEWFLIHCGYDLKQ